MNSRRWIIILVSIFVCLIIGFQVVWKVMSLEDKFRDLITAQLQASTKSEVGIEKVTASLQSLNFHNVSLKFPDGPKEIKIRKLVLGFSLFNFLKYNLNPIRVISDIVVDQPVFKFSAALNDSVDVNNYSDTINFDSLETNYENRLIDLGFVGRIVINDGSIFWTTADSSNIMLLSKLKGWISTTDLEKSSIRMQGQLFGSDNDNIELTGLSNLKTGRIDSLLINFFDENLSTNVPMIFPEILKIDHGELRGGGVIRHKEDGQLMLNGFFYVKDADLNLFEGKVHLRNLNSQAFIENWNVKIQSCSLNYNESLVQVSGFINNLLDPKFDLVAESKDIELENIAKLINQQENVDISGKVDTKLEIKDFAKNPVITGNIFSSDVSIQNQKIDNLNANFTYQNYLLNVNQLTGSIYDFSFQNSGFVDFSSEFPILDFQFNTSGDLKKESVGILNSEVVSLPTTISGHLFSLDDTLNATAKIDLFGKFAKKDSIPINGTLQFHHKTVNLNFSNGDKPFNLQTQINFADKQVQIESNLVHFGGDLWDLTSFPLRDHFKEKIDLSLNYTGDNRYAVYSLLAHRKEFTGDSDKLFKIDGFFNSNGKTKLQGEITYFPDTGDRIPGKLDMTITENEINLNEYKLGDFYSASARIDLKNDNKLSGNFTIKNTDLVYIFDGIFLQPNFDLVGKLSGELTLAGTISRPEIFGHLNFKDGIIRAAGYYSGDANVQFSDNKLNLQNVDLNLDDQKLLNMNGSIDLGEELLDLEIKGQNVDIPAMLSLIIGDEIDFLSGKADIDLTVTDQIKNPNLAGTLVANNGLLFFVNYDTLKLDIGKTAGSSQTIKNTPGLYIQNASLTRGKRYSIQGTGYLPFSQNEDMDIRLQGTGDAFAILFEEEPFILGSRSDTKFNWGFGGTYSSPVYTEGHVSLKNGMVQLEDLAPIVENIECDVTLEPLNQFLRFDNFTGTVRDRPFYGKTSMDSTLLASNLEPIIIDSWGLNFGIIEVSTGDKGIPLHLPGLIEEGEEGWFIVEGKDQNKNFSISGPAEHPLARGKIKAYDTPITFPFLIEENEPVEPTLTEIILESMIWDVDLVPVKDIRYVKKLPGLIDNVWINAYIDPKLSYLTLSGIIQDESFRAEGFVQSTRGTIEYLDLTFTVDKFAAEFDRSDIFPIVYGKARTTISDSTGFPSNIYLTLYAYDKENKQELERGRWSDDIRFRLSSDNPTIGTNEGQILAVLGYSFDTINSVGMIGTSTDNLVFRPLFRPVERKLERTFGLDVIRFRSHFTRNVMDALRPRSSTGNVLYDYNYSDPNSDFDPRYLLFRSSQVTLGKFFSENLYFLYSGQLDAGRNRQYQEQGLGFRHSLDLEYRIFPNLLLELQYNYDSLLQNKKEDKRIQLRHSFNF